eukprot:15475420-Alexandrium_andersonii.AAC.1
MFDALFQPQLGVKGVADNGSLVLCMCAHACVGACLYLCLHLSVSDCVRGPPDSQPLNSEVGMGMGILRRHAGVGKLCEGQPN